MRIERVYVAAKRKIAARTTHGFATYTLVRLDRQVPRCTDGLERDEGVVRIISARRTTRGEAKRFRTETEAES